MRTRLPGRDSIAWLAVAGLTLSLALPLVAPWRALELRVLDLLATTHLLDGARSPIVIVGIDETSFREVGRQWPWPRDLHARLVDRLTEAGAKVIALDILFADPAARKEEDDALAEALRRSGRVVLAADEEPLRTEHVLQHARVDPIEPLERAARAIGLAGVSLDDDAVLRRLPEEADAFWRAVLRAARVPARAPPEPGFIRFTDPERAFPYASYYQALDPRRSLRPDFFRDRIVLVGLNLRASPDPGGRLADRYATPLLAWTDQLMPGVEVQAHALHSVLQGRTIGVLAWWSQAVVALLAIAAAAWGFRTWVALRCALIAVLVAAALALGAWAAVARFDRWMPILAPLAGVALLYLAQGARSFAREQALRRRIRRTFGYYVSPHVVEEMLAHPDRLRLGGERRTLTMLFGDLAGFTTMAEHLPPEDVVHILNRHLTAMTRIVTAHGGTVDKFMGDAIMAFWGAPVPDPDHAWHAAQTAIAMQAASAELAEELAGAGHPRISMRIGIHSGVAAVGNMGSDTLFDYTVVGDDVNLASRLEGANKAYGTLTLLSEATALLLEGRVPLRPVDRVRVKGRAQAVDVLTPEEDERVRKWSEELVAAYRARRWDDAEAAARTILASRADDEIAALYLERIPRLRRTALPDDWDAAESLESK